jgi:hypothetical protein
MCMNKSLVQLGYSNKLFLASKMHIFIARGIGITSLELTLGPVDCIVAKTTVSLFRFKSPDSDPRGLAPL